MDFLSFLNTISTTKVFFTLCIIQLIVILLKKTLNTYTSLEIPPQISHGLSEKRRTFGESAANVKIGLYVHNFPHFSILDGQFSLDGTVWFEFRPSQVSIEDLEKFEFFEGTITQKSVAQIKCIKNKIFVAYNFRVTFTSLLNYKKFPFADHRVFLILKNEALSARELHFSALEGGITLIQNLHSEGWKLRGTKVEAGIIRARLEHGNPKKTMLIPVTVFEFNFQKPGFRHIILTFVPVFLLFYLSLLSLVFYAKVSLSISLASVSGLIVYRFVIENISPKPGYSTVIDNFYMLILTFSFLIFIFHNYDLSHQNIKFLDTLSDIGFYLFQLIMLFVLWRLLRTEGGFKKIDLFSFPKIIWKEKVLSLPKLLTLKAYQKIADNFEKFPQKNNKGLLAPGDKKIIFEETTPVFSQISKKILNIIGLDIQDLSPSHFKKIIECAINIRESQGWNQHHILLHRLIEGEKFYIWGDLQGAFSSLMRTLKELEKKGIINNQLQIMHPRHFFIFNGNVIGHSSYNFETLSLIITLILKNPENVIFLKGPHEEKSFWLNLELRDELEILAKGLSSETSTLKSFLSRFFATLPETLYLGEINQGADQYITISPGSPHLVDSDLLLKSLQDKSTASFEVLKTNHFSDSVLPLILAQLRGLDDEEHYNKIHGVDLLPPEEGATHWSIFSRPIEAYRGYSNFNCDSYGILEIGTSLSNSILKRLTRELHNEKHFHEKDFDLLSGYSLKHKESFKAEYEVRVGSTLDLSETSSILGERLKRGLDLRFRKANKEGGVKGGFLRLFFANDKYTPSLTLQNVLKLISERETTLILSPLGTPTTKALIPLSQEEKILVLFPYTGGSIFRNPELKNFINYRACYAEEASALVRYAHDVLFSQRYAFFYQDDDYGLSLLNASKKILLEEYKLPDEAICEAPYQRNTVLIDNAAFTIEKFSPDVIFFFSTYPPSRALIEKIGVQRLSNVTLMGTSFLTDRFREYASGMLDPEQQGKGLSFIISRVVPNPKNSKIEIVKEYQCEMQSEYPDIHLDVDSLEGYINASILIYILESIDRPYTHKKIIQAAKKIKNQNFKGLILNFDPNTQSLSTNVWLDLGNGVWM